MKETQEKVVHLKHLSSDGGIVEAHFSPTHGMNLLSFKKNGLELIDQSTKDDFKRRFGGLGPLIGPHFYHREREDIKEIDEKSFPHIKVLGDLSKTDPLSHGIGRYVSWNYDETSTSISGHICGLDTHNGQTLASFEGFNFELKFHAKVTASGLDIKYSVSSQMHPSTIGLHYYLSLPDKKGIITMKSKDQYNDMGTFKDIPKEWKDKDGNLSFNLDRAADFGFWPDSSDKCGQALLSTPSHKLKISYKADSEQNAFQIYHPKDASFVCIEPVSAIDPRAPSGTDHKLHIKLEVL